MPRPAEDVEDMVGARGVVVYAVQDAVVSCRVEGFVAPAGEERGEAV